MASRVGYNGPLCPSYVGKTEQINCQKKQEQRFEVLSGLAMKGLRQSQKEAEQNFVKTGNPDFKIKLKKYQLQELESCYQSLKDENEQTKIELQKTKIQVQSKDTEIQHLTSKNQDLISRKRSLEKDYDAVQAERDAKKRKLIDSENENKGLQQQIAIKETRHTQDSQKIEKQSNEIEDLKRALEKEKKMREETQAKTEKMVHQLSQKEQEIAQLKAENQSTKITCQQQMEAFNTTYNTAMGFTEAFEQMHEQQQQQMEKMKALQQQLLAISLPCITNPSNSSNI